MMTDLFASRGRWSTVPPVADRIDASGDCWEWTGSTRNGYGNLHVDGRTEYAHRYVYEALVGAIPDGLEIDHLCQNRPCVNPDHLEPVTHAENLRRAMTRTRCKSGHTRRYRDVYPSKTNSGCLDCKEAREERYNASRRARYARLKESPVGATRAERTEGGN